MAQLRFNVSIVTGTLNGVSNANVTGGSVFIGQDFRKIEDLTAHLIVTAATSSLTAKVFWQVSNDNSTFSTLQSNAGAAANIAIATGAQNITTEVEAPRGVLQYKFARAMIAVAGATGGSSDLFSIGYCYRQID